MTIQKPDFNQIFASQAPDVDKPPVFNNYNGGWGDESRPNNGKPTIKGFNFIQQLTDTKLLWLKQNAILPYDSDTDYPIGVVTLRGGKFQKWDGSNWVDFIKLEDSKITTWSGRTQEEHNKENPSPFDYGAKGDATTNDTQAFADLELVYQGQIIDLLGKTYLVDRVFSGNEYINGFFLINGILQTSNFDTSKLKKKKYCTNFLTAINGSPIFSGANTGTFQGFCIIPQADGTSRLYVTQRSHRTDGNVASSNWFKYETYRIVEYLFKEDGSDVVPISFSEPLDIGHASYLSYTIDNGQLYFYSGFPSDSTTDDTRSNKGFSRIKWRGALTSNSDVQLYQLYDFADGRYSYLHRGAVSVSKSGKNLLISSDNQITGQYTTHIFSLQALLSANDPKTIDPLYSFNWSSEGKTIQGTILTENYIVSVYDDKNHTTALKIRTLDGYVVQEIDAIDLYGSYYSKDQLMGQGGVFTRLETEGLWLHNNALYIGYRDYISTPTNNSYISYQGRYFAPIEASTNINPSNTAYWQEVSSSVAVGATEWSATTNYVTTGYVITSYNKRIYKISALDGIDLFKTNRKPQVVASNRHQTVDMNYGYKLLGYDSFDNKTIDLLTVREGGNALFKAKTLNDIALSSSTEGTGTFFGGYRYNTLYFGMYTSTSNAVISSRNGNNLILCTNSDSSGASSSDPKITRSSIALDNNENNPTLRPMLADVMQLGLPARRFTKGWLNNLNINALAVHADNVAAKTGGLIVGDVYRTATGQLMIVY